jgi:cyclopropane-fatty-acyl-phospholipid synthase
MTMTSVQHDAGMVARRDTPALGGVVSAVAKRLVHGALSRVRDGQIDLAEGGDRRVFGGGTDLSATVRVLDRAFYPSVAFGGNIGAAESYMRGEWVCDRLTDLSRIVVRNRGAFNALDGVTTLLAKPARAVTHWLRRNTVSGSRRNIARHYDLSNAFFEAWLDPSMMYSSGLYRTTAGVLPPEDLEGAQAAKLARIVAQLGLKPGDHLGEIGTGWGGLASYAARSAGCRVTTTTISRAQAGAARERARGLPVEVIEEDYRVFAAARPGAFDSLVSVEMVEAVGHQYLLEYFRCCQRLLRPGGRFLMQAIVIVDEHYEQALHHVDFIKKHIFPGSFIPCRRVLREGAAAAGLRARGSFEMGMDYAVTLAEWRRRFFAALPRIRALSPSFDDRFIRMWEWYLCYCEAGFREGHLGVVQVLMEKPR